MAAESERKRAGERSIERTLRIAASPEVVFDLITDASLIPRWMGESAETDPRPGGIYRCSVVHRDLYIRGEFLEVDRPHRVVLSWGWEGGSDRLIPPGSSRVEFTLRADAGETVLHMRHSGLPPGHDVFHDMGFAHYLARLSEAAAGRDPGPDPGAELMKGAADRLPPPPPGWTRNC